MVVIANGTVANERNVRFRETQINHLEGSQAVTIVAASYLSQVLNYVY